MNAFSKITLGLVLLVSFSSLCRADERAEEIDRLEASSSRDFIAKPNPLKLPRLPKFARLATHYNLRVYQKGSEQGLQLDVQNIGTYQAYGPSVSVTLKRFGFLESTAVYPYYGGNTSKANTVFPGQLGYIVMTLPANLHVVQGEAMDVTIRPNAGCNFPEFSGTMIACQKGSYGCE